jgi:RNA polymerase sigma-70 factor, ECF subfamily
MRMQPRVHPGTGALRILGKMAAETGRAADSEVAQLLAGCARQDRQAFQRLYERTASQLLACLIRMLRNRTLAEDALQDAFVQVWARAGQYDARRGSAWAWMIAIARYRAIDLRRREARVAADPHADVDEIPAEDEPQDALAALGRSATRALTTCLEALQPRQRQCIVLAYQGGLTHAEVAGATGEPLGSVKSWIRRGLTALKRCLES